MKKKKKALTRRTRILLRLVIKHLKNNPKKYNQNCLFTGGNDCGTPLCIIGWYQVFRRARKWRDELPKDLRLQLYWPNRWPGDFYVPNVGDGSWDGIKASTAIKRIQLFLDTDGAK